MEYNDVSVKDIMYFIKRDYLNHVWNQGISNLYSMFPKKYNYDCDSIDIRMKEGRLHIDLKYPDTNFTFFCDWLIFSKRDDQLTLASSSFSLEEQEKILSEIDFFPIYCNFENQYFDKRYFLNALYSFNDIEVNFDIIVCYDSIILVHNSSYFLAYLMKLGEFVRLEKEIFNSDYVSLIKLIQECDPNFLEHLTVNFIDLPIYIQNLFDDTLKKEENVLKKVFSRVIKK